MSYSFTTSSMSFQFWIQCHKLQLRVQILHTEVLVLIDILNIYLHRFKNVCWLPDFNNHEAWISKILNFAFTGKNQKCALIFHLHGGMINSGWVAVAVWRQLCSLSTVSHCQPQSRRVWMPFVFAYVLFSIFLWAEFTDL